MRVVVADDEAPARRMAAGYLAAMPGVVVAGEAADGPAAVETLERLRPDLVLLDVRMPGLSGFEVVAELARRGVPIPRVVFATAYDVHAVAAFDMGAVDYLLKPYDRARLERAVGRALLRPAGVAPPVEGAAALEPGRYARHLYAGERGRIVPVPVHTVRWVEAADDYALVHAAMGTYLAGHGLSALEARLDPADFARVHRSAIVRLGAVRALRRDGSGGLVLAVEGGADVRVGRTYAPAVRARFA